MKSKSLPALLLGTAQLATTVVTWQAEASLVMAGTSEPVGTLAFSNSRDSLVINCLTGLPVTPGVAVAGLYLSRDLDAAPIHRSQGTPSSC